MMKAMALTGEFQPDDVLTQGQIQAWFQQDKANQMAKKSPIPKQKKKNPKKKT